MQVIQVGTSGTNGEQGNQNPTPDASGGSGTAGGDATAIAASATDTTNTAQADGGQGGSGGNGADAPAPGEGGGGGGNGAPGGDADAVATTVAPSAESTASATAQGGTGGDGGLGGEPSALSGLGARGGTATAQASSTDTAGVAIASATAIGGNGGDSPLDTLATPNVRQAPDGNVATVIAARAVGGSEALVTADQVGGAGGSGAIAGSGADSTLTNAVSGQTNGGFLRLEQDAQGGSAGLDDLVSQPVAGASGTSSLTYTDASSTAIEVIVTATGGIGSRVDLNGVASINGNAGDGGAADATADITGNYDSFNTPETVQVIDTAYGGNGRTGGAATATATGKAAGTAIVTATAAPLSNSGETAAGPAMATATGIGNTVTVTAIANAVAVGNAAAGTAAHPGGPAAATATGIGAGVVTARASSGYHLTGIKPQELDATATAPVLATSVVVADVSDGGTLGAFDTTDQAVSTAVLDPTAAAGGTDLAAGDLLLFDSEEGGGAFGTVTSPTTITATLGGTLDLSSFDASDDLMIDLPSATLVGTGVTGVTFSLSVGTGSISQSFTSAAAALTYFTHDVIDLGALGGLRTAQGTAALSLSLGVTVDAAGSGFYVDPVAGAPAPCYARGTRIATPSGPVAIERLAVGNLVLTLAGTARPIVWAGSRAIDIARHPRPALVRPVRIRAHAFTAGVPCRDLLLSPDHAVFVDGVLIPAKYLVDGFAVTVEPASLIEYHHIELATHDVVLVEGLPAETLLDVGTRDALLGAARALSATAAPARSDAVWEAHGYAPLVVAGPALDAVRARLSARAARLRMAPRSVRAGPARRRAA